MTDRNMPEPAIHIDLERMEKALASLSLAMPPGLTIEQKRACFLGAAQATEPDRCPWDDWKAERTIA